MIQVRRSILIGMIFLSMLFIGCQWRMISLAERFPDHMVFSKGDLRNARLSFMKTNEGATSFHPIKKFDLPDGTILMMPPADVRGYRTLGEATSDPEVVELFTGPRARPCAWTKIWFNETKTVSIVVCIPDTAYQARIPATDAAEPALPTFPDMEAMPDAEFTAQLTKNKKSRSYLCFNVNLLLRGMIEDRTLCSCVCIWRFISEGGIVIPVTDLPNRDPDSEVTYECGGGIPDGPNGPV